MLVAGIVLIVLVLLFGIIGSAVTPRARADVGAGRPSRPPSVENLLGTDQQGRDVLANLMYGTPSTLKIGLIAGIVGVTIGTLLGLIGGYIGGAGDATIRLIVDVFLTIPNLMVLIVIASMISGVTIEQMGLIIALLAWMYPARTIRAQVLTLRERTFVQVARLSGMGGFKILIRELLPNLIPFVAASLVGTIASAFTISQAQSTMEFFMSGSMAKVLTLLAVVGILMLRPQGLFALKVRK